LQVTQQALLRRIADVIGNDALDLRETEREFFSRDALGSRGNRPEPVLPLGVVRPADAEAVARLLSLCSQEGVPVIAYGAGTGLMGGARSEVPAIVLDTSRLNDIRVQAEDGLVWAGSGAILAAVDATLRPHGLCVGHDPWTFPVATVGGPISTNGLGYTGGRYGGIGDQVLALEVALTDGTLFRTRAVRRRSTGPDLARLFVGAEGTLGIITAAALKVFAIPEKRELRAVGFETFEAGFDAIVEINRLGMRPSLLDYGEGHGAIWREPYPPTLYLGFEGFREQVDASLSRALAVIAGYGGVLLPQETAQEFWDDRHVIAERFARDRARGERRVRNPGIAFDYLHVALPASKTLEFRARCHAAAESEGVAIAECGLWLGPELFSTGFALPEADGGQERLTLFMRERLMEVQDLGGSMEYVHGVGTRLADLMEREHGAALNVLKAIKATLDPDHVLNPGKLNL
jgi:FAD/FMN-containing dehydrogenase